MVSLNASPNCGTEKQLANPQITKTNTNLYVHTHHLRETQQLSAPQLEGELHRKAFSFSAFSRDTKRAVLQQQRQHT